ncbi:MAG: cytochrome C [Bacteroidota bacterium]
MTKERTIRVFLDEEEQPFAEFAPPVKFEMDTTKIPDGKHILKVVAKSSKGNEGIRTIPFEVRNGPQISIIGLKDNEVVDNQLPITINAYGSESQETFVITGSETPKAVPSWVWVLLISFVAFAIFYSIMNWHPNFYKSFF